MLARSGGEASPAKMRKASRMDDLPVLLRPVIRLMRARPSSLSCRSERNRSMVSEEILDFIDSTFRVTPRDSFFQNFFDRPLVCLWIAVISLSPAPRTFDCRLGARGKVSNLDELVHLGFGKLGVKLPYGRTEKRRYKYVNAGQRKNSA